VGAVGQILCGQSRPHFFNGVVQVVQRLFEIIHPDVAVFLMKTTHGWHKGDFSTIILPLLHLAYIADNFHACSVSMPYFGFCLF
jgi:hypothetical protein